MLLNFLICLLIAGAVYSLTFPDSRFPATASAIRQIWSGNCRLSCRQSEFSGLSGLSGLNPGHIHDKKDCRVAHSSHAGPSSGCVCEACPCTFIENILRSVRPATTLYSRIVDLIATCCYTVFETFYDIYKYVESVISCGTSCQRHPQLIESQDSTSDNIYFGTKKLREGGEVRQKPKNSDLALKIDKSIVVRDDADTSIKCPENKGPKTGVSDVTLKPKEEGSVTSGDINSCPKCVEQGKVCMKSCPKAKVKKKK